MQDIRWFTMFDGSRRAFMDSPYGTGIIVKYKDTCYCASVVGSLAECYFDTLEDCMEFIAHPFRVILPSDYWNGSAIIHFAQ